MKRIQRNRDRFVRALLFTKANLISLGEAETIFSKAAGKVRWSYERWLINEKSGAQTSETYCPRCACKAAKKLGGDWTVDGWDESFERDSPSWCDVCGVLLHHSLTGYGVDTELLESPVESVRRGDAAILANLASGIGDLRERHHLQLKQLAFLTWWSMRKRPS